MWTIIVLICCYCRWFILISSYEFSILANKICMLILNIKSLFTSKLEISFRRIPYQYRFVKAPPRTIFGPIVLINIIFNIYFLRNWGFWEDNGSRLKIVRVIKKCKNRVRAIITEIWGSWGSMRALQRTWTWHEEHYGVFNIKQFFKMKIQMKS